MDIIAKTQVTSSLNIIIALMTNAGVPDTGATLTVKAINPDGSENAAFTQPTITEVISASGVYRLVFASAAATPLFTLENQYNPYTLLVKSNTAGSTGYRAISVYCVDRLQGDIATSSAVSSLPTTAAIAAAVPTLTAITTAVPNAAAITAAVPTVAQIKTGLEASTILAMEATNKLNLKLMKNKKVLTSAAGVYSLVVYDDNDIDEIMRKTIKDINGADISTIGAGIIAREMKSSV